MDNCPESKTVADLKNTVAVLKSELAASNRELDRLRSLVYVNAEYRLYDQGYNDGHNGRRTTDAEPFRKVYRLVLVVGTSVILLLIGLLSYILIGAEATVEIFKKALTFAGKFV